MINLSSKTISKLIVILVVALPLFFIYGMWANDLSTAVGLMLTDVCYIILLYCVEDMKGG